MPVGNVVWKVVGISAGLLASKVSRSVVEKTWRKTKHTDPPRNPEAPGTTFNEALTWAIASGITMGVARMLATRSAAKAWKRTTGHLPPGLEDVGA